MYSVLTLEVPLPLPRVFFVRTIQFFLEQILRSEYSTVWAHALGLVPAIIQF